jgi:hypothetical protein
MAKNLYYTPSSGSIVSQLIIEDNISTASTTYSDVTLEITASAYDTSGSFSSTVGTLRAYIRSGSTIYASFPLEEVSIYYNSVENNPLSIPAVTSSIYPINYIFSPDSTLTSSLNTLRIYNVTNTSSSLLISGSFDSGLVSLNLNDTYSIQLTGSGLYYSASIVLVDNSTNTTAINVSSTNTPIASNFSASIINNYTLTATTQTYPTLLLTYTSSTAFPVSPTSSLEAWNFYLGTFADQVTIAESSSYLIGGDLLSRDTLIISGSQLNKVSTFGLTGLISCSISASTLTSFPSITGSSNLSYYSVKNQLITSSTPDISIFPYIIYVDVSYNSLSGSIIPFSSSLYINTFICNNNALTGSIPSLGNNYNLTYFNCRRNKLSNYISGSAYASLNYFDAFGNQLPQSSVDGILQDLDNAGGYNGYVDLQGGTNSALSITGLTYKTNLENRGWEVKVN